MHVMYAFLNNPLILKNLLFVVLGLVFGSFLAAFSYRYPRGLSIMKGRSLCPKCKKQIKWYDNIPLFSFVVLRGRCRSCDSEISFRYPIIEFFTAVGFLTIGLSSGSWVHIIYSFSILSILILIFIIDFEHQIIPDQLIFWGILITFLKLLLSDSGSIYGAFFAGFLASASLFSVHLITKGKGMGLGDVKFAVLGGMIIGMKLLFIWLFSAFLTGALTGIILILIKKARLKDAIAFGPFLLLGLAIAFFWGEKIYRLLFA